jgi:S1-C subfamily serine protease
MTMGPQGAKSFCISVLASTLLSGCAGVKSTVNLSSSAAKSVVYPITPRQANAVAYAGIMEVPGGYPLALPPPMIGYVATKRVLANQHTWQAIAERVEFPQPGTDEKGHAFAFGVKHDGTLFEGPSVASRIFKRMLTNAEEICKSIQLTPQQIANCRIVPAIEAGAGPEQRGVAYGTGFALTTNGTIATAFHVVEHATNIQVRFPGGEWAAAKITSHSRNNDIAILQTAMHTPYAMPLVPTAHVKRGDQVFTFGFPVIDLLGGEAKYTDGKVSGLSGLKGEDSLLQVTVPIQPGNSGGPLVNPRGEVVGLVTSTAAVKYFYAVTETLPQNVNWAVRSDYISVLIPRDYPLATALPDNDVIDWAAKTVCLIKAE